MASQDRETTTWEAPMTNGHHPFPVITSIPEVPVTQARRPFLQSENDERILNAGTARATISATFEHPKGTEGEWAEKNRGRTVLQQHCDFFDPDKDGVIWPQDTFVGLRKLGFNIWFSLLAAIIIHSNFSYPTVTGWVPDPFFRIYLDNIHKDKHGSDTGTYDNEGRFIPQKFEDTFSKYAEGRDYLTWQDLVNMHKGQRLVMDPFGWSANVFEWVATYLLLWPEDGRLMKEDIRRIYDGSLFYVMADRQAGKYSKQH